MKAQGRRLEWTNAGVFAGVLYLLLTSVSAVTIFGFGQYEGKLGSRLDNLLIDQLLYLPLTLASTLGYVAARIVSRPSPVACHRCRAAAAGVAAAALVLAPALVSDLFAGVSTAAGLSFAAIYCIGIGALVSLLSRWPARRK